MNSAKRWDAIARAILTIRESTIGVALFFSFFFAVDKACTSTSGIMLLAFMLFVGTIVGLMEFDLRRVRK